MGFEQYLLLTCLILGYRRVVVLRRAEEMERIKKAKEIEQEFEDVRHYMMDGRLKGEIGIEEFNELMNIGRFVDERYRQYCGELPYQFSCQNFAFLTLKYLRRSKFL